MIKPYYDNEKNSVFLRGALNPINPETNEVWASEQQALTFIANLPEEAVIPPAPQVVITNVSGNNVVYRNNIIDVDAKEPVTVAIEIQRDGKTMTELTRVFRVPVDRDGQQGVKVLSLAIKNGVGQLTTQFDTGEFFINEQTINRRLTAEEHMVLPQALTIVVAEAIPTAIPEGITVNAVANKVTAKAITVKKTLAKTKVSTKTAAKSK